MIAHILSLDNALRCILSFFSALALLLGVFDSLLIHLNEIIMHFSSASHPSPRASMHVVDPPPFSSHRQWLLVEINETVFRHRVTGAYFPIVSSMNTIPVEELQEACSGAQFIACGFFFLLGIYLHNQGLTYHWETSHFAIFIRYLYFHLMPVISIFGILGINSMSQMYIIGGRFLFVALPVFVEEIHKYHFGMFLPVFELVLRIVPYYIQGHLHLAFLPFVMHIVTLQLDPVSGFLLHLVWNYKCLSDELFAQIPYAMFGVERDLDEHIRRQELSREVDQSVMRLRASAPDFVPSGDLSLFKYRLSSCSTDDQVDVVCLLARDEGVPEYLIRRERAAWEHSSERGHEFLMDWTFVSSRMSKAKASSYRDIKTTPHRKPSTIPLHGIGKDWKYAKATERAPSQSDVGWIIPHCKGPIARDIDLTPANYSPQRARLYIWSLAARLRHDNPSKVGKYKVIGTSQARLLFYGVSNPHPAVLVDLIDNCRVFFSNVNASHTHDLPSRPLLSDYFPKTKVVPRSLRVLGDEVYKSSDLESMRRTVFKRHVPVYRAACLYLDGESSVDRATVQMGIDRACGVLHPQSGLLSAAKQELSTALSPAMEDVRRAGSLGASLLDVMLDQQFSALKDLGAGTVRFVALIAALKDASSLGGVISICILYLTGCSDLKGKLTYLREKIAGLAFLSKQGSAEFFSSSLGDLFSLDFGRQIWETVVAAVAYVFCSDVLKLPGLQYTEWMARKCSDIINGVGKKIQESFISSLFDTLVVYVRILKECITTRSLDPLFGRRSYKSWVFDANAALTFQHMITLSQSTVVDQRGVMQNLRDKKLIPQSWVEPFTPQAYVEMIESLMLEGSRFMEVLGSQPVACNLVSKEHKRLSAFLELYATSTDVMAARIVPFSLCWPGPPGTGKTTAAAMTEKVIARSRGYPLDEQTRYQWQQNVNFQTGLKQSTLFITADDIDQNVAPPTRGCDSHTDVIIKVVNNMAMPVEEADVNKKGTTCARPVGFNYLTNFSGLRLKGYCLEPIAIYRRFNFKVELTVRPEYALPGGLLDKVKASQCSDGELHWYKVRVFSPDLYDAGNPFGCDPFRHVATMTRAQFNKFIVKAFDEHMENQLNLMRNLRRNEGFCPSCYADVDVLGNGCSCHNDVPIIFPQVEVVEEKQSGPITSSSASPKVALFMMNIGEGDSAVSSILRAIGVSYWPSKTTIAILISFFWLLKRFGMLRFLFKIAGNYGRVATASAEYVEECVREAVAWIPSVEVLALFAAASAGVYGMYNYLSGPKNSLQANVDNSAGGPPASWVRASQVYKPGLPDRFHGLTLENIKESATNAWLRVENPNANEFVGGVQIASNAFLTVWHILKVRAEADGLAPEHFNSYIEVIQRGIRHKINVSPINCFKIGSKDACVITCGTLVSVPSILKAFAVDLDTGVSLFDEGLFLGPEFERAIIKPRVITEFGQPCLTGEFESNDGDCTSLYLMRANKRWNVYGIHIARLKMETPATALGITTPVDLGPRGHVVTRLELERALRALGTVLQGGYIVRSQFKPESISSITHYPKKSEVLTAVTHHGVEVFPLGCATKPIFGSTPPADVGECMFKEDFADLELLWCGRRDYWQKPIFKGKMVAGKWCSPYSNSLIPLKRTAPDETMLWFCILDYLSVVPLAQTEGYRSLSHHEVVSGIPGSLVGSMNLKTSTGPPFNVKKTAHIFRNDVEVFKSPELAQILQEFEDVFEEGTDFPIPLCIGTDKSEPVKFSKNDTQSTRIFNNMSMGANEFSKSECAAVKAFIRRHPTLFESFVGIDMGSSGARVLDDFLRSMSTKNGIETDFRYMDKSSHGSLLVGVARVYYALAFALRLNPLKAYSVIEGLRNTATCYKNDLFQEGGQNPSGNDSTVEINGIEQSQIWRYGYYSQKYPTGIPQEMCKIIHECVEKFMEDPFHVVNTALMPLFTFRKDVALATYGDDSDMSTSDACRGWWDLNVAAAKIKADFGMEITDGQKRDQISYAPVDSLTFLKRSAVFDPDLGFYRHPIDKKSLAKMLCMRKTDSALTDHDHHAVILSNVLREMVLHGRDDYEEMRRRAILVADKYGLSLSNKFQAPEYGYYYEKLRSGEFRTWWIPGEKPVTEEQKTKIEIMNQSGSIVNATVGSDMLTQETHDVGDILEHSALEVSGTTGAVSRVHQKMPSSSLENFLCRYVRVSSASLSSTNTGNILSFDPWALFLTNSAVRDKVKNFAYIRGTIEVMFTVTAPAGGYGMYVASVVPDGGPASTSNTVEISATQYLETCRQTQHCCIDMANCENVKFSLPFLWPMDWASLPAGPVHSWTVNLWTLQPLSSATSDTTLNGSVSIFVRLAEDYQLVVPINQSGKMKGHPKLEKVRNTINDKVMAQTGGLKASEALSKVSGIAGMMSSVPFLAPFSAPVAGGAAMLSGILDSWGFTRTTAPEPPQPVVPRPYANLANYDCDDTSEVAALSIANTLSFDPTLSGGVDGEDPMAINEICARMTLIKIATWTMANTAGTVLATIPITPFYHRTTSGGADMLLTPAAYIGLPFQYWRGDAEYTILMPVSKFHRGELQVCYVSTGPSGGEITNILLNSIIDASAGSEWNFKIGYARDRPVLETRLMNDIFPSIVPFDIATNGYLVIKVVNPLTSPVEAADTNLFIFSSWYNMTYGVPKVMELKYDGAFPANPPTVIPFDVAYINQSGTLGDEPGESNTVELVPFSGDYPAAEILFGEKILSLRSLMQKFSRDYIATNNSTEESLVTCHKPPIVGMPDYTVPSLGDGEACFTWAGWYATLFTGIACSTRYKLINIAGVDADGLNPDRMPPLSMGASALPYNLGFFSGVNSRRPNLHVSTVNPVWTTGIGDAVEVTVPYYGSVNYERCREANLVNFGSSQTQRMDVLFSDYCCKLTTVPVTKRYIVYRACGPDVRVNMFRFVPKIQYNGGTSPTNPAWVNN